MDTYFQIDSCFNVRDGDGVREGCGGVCVWGGGDHVSFWAINEEGQVNYVVLLCVVVVVVAAVVVVVVKGLFLLFHEKKHEIYCCCCQCI